MMRDDSGTDRPEPQLTPAPNTPFGPVLPMQPREPTGGTEIPPPPGPEPSVEAEVPTAPHSPSPAPTTRRRRREPRAGGRGRRELLILAVVAAVLVAVGLAFNFSSGSDDPSEPAPAAGTTPAVPRSDTTRVYDRFDRVTPAHTLGRAETGQPWAVIGPTWSVIDNDAVLDVDAAGSRSIAVIAEAGSDGIVQVRAEAVAPAAGLVFRFEDFRNYWALTAAPRSATWNLQRVVDGETTIVGNIGTVGAADGTTIAVRFQGAEITVLVGGVEQRTFEDQALADRRGVGLTAFLDEANPVRFDDFTMNTLTVGASDGPTTPESTTPGPVDGGDG